MGVMKPELVMRSIIPVVMAGVIGIYGLIIAVIVGTGGKHSFTVGIVFSFGIIFLFVGLFELYSFSSLPSCSVAFIESPLSNIFSFSPHCSLTF